MDDDLNRRGDAVKVKLLAWKQVREDAWEAPCPFGTYSIRGDFDFGITDARKQEYHVYFRQQGLYRAQTAEAAQAVGQADYKARILKSIDTPAKT